MSSNERLYPQTSEVFRVLDNMYPGLVFKVGDHMYLKDSTISNKLLTFSLNTMANSIQLYGNGFVFTLDYLSTRSEGQLCMDYDFKLSLDSSMKLFANNIEILYIDTEFKSENYSKYVMYDKEIITRQHTIQNIIK